MACRGGHNKNSGLSYALCIYYAVLFGTQYIINVAGYTGDAGDSLTSGIPFYTVDESNGGEPLAQKYLGGWWFNEGSTSFSCLACSGGFAQWGSLPDNEPRIIQSRMMIQKCRYN